MSEVPPEEPRAGGRGVITGIVSVFLTSHLSIIFLGGALLAGLAAILATPSA